MKKTIAFLLLGVASGCTTLTQNTNPEPQNKETQMATFDKFEIVKSEPYRFIGKSIFIGNKGSFGCFDLPQGSYLESGCAETLHGRVLHEYLWSRSDGIFKVLDELKEYATDEVHNVALFTWDKYEDKHALYGYTIGRFMKADTPVPPDMDYYDIPAGYLAKGFVKMENVEKCQGTRLAKFEDMIEEELKQHKEFEMIYVMAEVYTKPDENGGSFVGLYHFGKEKK